METYAPPRAATQADVPVLDFSPVMAHGDLSFLARELRTACLNTGFFYVANHGVPDEVVKEAFAASRAYFSTPVEQRLRHRMDERFRRGYVPFGISRQPGYKPDLKERFDWGLHCDLDDPLVIAGKPLYGPNRWPDDMPWFRPKLELYAAAVSALGLRVLRVIALSLELPETFFEGMFQKSCITHNMLHYPPQPEVADREFGSTQHTDYGLITVLSQDPIGGLEVQTRSGEWIAAPYVPGTFVINLGDLFKVWSNDVYVSNMHRVVNRTGRERFSIANFINTDYDVLVNPVPTCVSKEQPAKYDPILAGDYLLQKFRAVQGYKI